MRTSENEMIHLSMDIRDCLTVLKGLIQISSNQLKQEHLMVANNNINTADLALTKLMKNIKELP